LSVFELASWLDRILSRETPPDEAAMRKEAGGEVDPPLAGFALWGKDFFADLLAKLLKKEPAHYIVLKEFLLREGYFSVRGGKISPRCWGLYSQLAERWALSPNTIKNWLVDALRFIAAEGRSVLNEAKRGEKEVPS
jgi:hypothetical protein